MNADPEAGFDQWENGTLRRCGVLLVNVKNPVEKYKAAVQFKAEPMMVMDIPKTWTNLEDYQNALSSKYRVRYKKVLEKSQILKKTSCVGSELTESSKNKMVALLAETLKEKTIALPKDLSIVFNSFIDFYQNKFIIQCYFEHENLVGFMSFVRKSNNTLFAMHVGFDPEVGKNTNLYQRMLYDAIEYSIENKIDSINFGRTATEIKSTVGAVPLENSFLAYVRNPLLRSIAKIYQKYFYKPAPYTIRNPFKN